MIEYNEREQEPEEDGGGGLAVAVVGIGGAGANVLDRIALEGMTEAELVCMNTDIRALTNSVAATKVQLGKNLTQGLGAGGDPDLGEDAAKSSEEEIRDAVRGKDIVFVCGGLGGGTGSGAAPFISGIARSEGAFVVAFTTMPFSFEGRRRLSQAQNSLNHLRKTANALITFDNDRMGSLVLPKQGIQEAFAEADKIISQSVRAVIQLVTKPGLISIGMDDLITALDNDDSRCLFGYGQATGENRAQEALSKALKSPLLDKGEMLEEAQNVLVHVCGGDSMTLFEVDLLMKSLEKEVSENAQILFGVGSDPKLGEKLSVTVISSMGKPLPPTADDSAPKAARSDSGDEQKDSAPAESPKPEAPESSRSEVKPDQITEKNKVAIPVAEASTGFGASMLASSAPKAEAASQPPRARMSPIRRAVAPVEELAAADDDGPVDKLPEVIPADVAKAAPNLGGSGKGIISIFEDEDDSESIFDEADDDLDDDLDLMGDLGLDDEELDRLVAESAAVGLDDDESEDADVEEEPLSLLEDADLDVAEEEGDAVSVDPPTAEVVAASESDQLAEKEELEKPFEETEDDFGEEDDLDEATVVAGAVVSEPPAPVPVADVPVVDPPVAEVAEVGEDDDFLSDESEEGDFESFDAADELEEEFDELEIVEEADDVEEVDDDEFSAEVEEIAEEFQAEDDDDPLFENEEEPAPAPPPSKAVAARVAPAQANKADELLKRVGLRRATGGAAQPARPEIAAQLPQTTTQQEGKTKFAWSRPSAEAASPDAGISAEEETVESRAKLPPPRGRAVPKAAPPALANEEAAPESPFTPKGFVKKKAEASADQPRRGLPIKPTPLKLNSAPAAKAAPVVEPDPIEPEPITVLDEEPEQQTFDSTLEPKHEKGRFEKGEPTVEDGEDLDLPTFLRRRKG